MKAAFQAYLNEEFESGKDYKPNKADWLDGRWSHLDKRGEEYQRGATAVDEANLRKVGKALTTLPKGYTVHRTVARLLDTKTRNVQHGQKFRLGHGRSARIWHINDRRLSCAPVWPRLYTRHL